MIPCEHIVVFPGHRDDEIIDTALSQSFYCKQALASLLSPARSEVVIAICLAWLRESYRDILEDWYNRKVNEAITWEELPQLA